MKIANFNYKERLADLKLNALSFSRKVLSLSIFLTSSFNPLSILSTRRFRVEIKPILLFFTAKAKKHKRYGPFGYISE